MCDRSLRSPSRSFFLLHFDFSRNRIRHFGTAKNFLPSIRPRERETIHSRGDRRNRFPEKGEEREERRRRGKARSVGRFLVRRKYERTDVGRESERAKAQDTVRIESERASIKEEAGQPRKRSLTSLKIRQSFLSPFQSQSLGPCTYGIHTIFAFFWTPHPLVCNSRNLSVLFAHKMGQLVDVIRVWPLALGRS